MSIYRAVLKQDDSNASAWSALAQGLHETNDHLLAAEAFVKAAQLTDEPGKAVVLYNAACEYALADRLDQSIELLKKAYAAGFKDRDAVNKDPDLAKLRNDPQVKELIEPGLPGKS